MDENIPLNGSMTGRTRKPNMVKRKPKNPIKFKIKLNDEQKRAKSTILDNTITVLTGQAGSGKTLLACQVALDMHFTRQIERIVITRPTVSKEDIGFLPGNLREKMDPWLQPIYNNMYMLYDKIKVDKYVEGGEIEIAPISYMRGRTFVDSLVIVDEAQNITDEQMNMLLTRLGTNSKMIICGDLDQNDLRNREETGFKFLYTLADKVKDFEVFELSTNHRNAIVDAIIQEYNTKNKPNK